MPQKYLFAVIGNPVAHSKSPAIHQAFAAQFGIALEYRRLLAPLDGFAGAVDALRGEGAAGANVTLPFKQNAYAYCDRLSARALRAGAVNTLIFRDGLCAGDNTDGVGLLRDLTVNLGLDLRAAEILILGAGGAVRGILEPLLAAGPASVFIANRSPDKARELAQEFGALGQLQGGHFDDLSTRRFQLIINATAASLTDSLPVLPAGILAPQGAAYDLVYAPQATPFMHWAASQGAACISDGLGMLVEQAAESFALWLGQDPQTAAIIADLRK